MELHAKRRRHAMTDIDIGIAEQRSAAKVVIACKCFISLLERVSWGRKGISAVEICGIIIAKDVECDKRTAGFDCIAHCQVGTLLHSG